MRLANVRWPDQLPGMGWSYGLPLDYAKELTAYWHDSYDWRAAEREINQIPQFTTTIDGQNTHFLHVRSAELNALPLLLVHGWPGSFLEFLDLIGPLTVPRAHGGEARDAFHVIAPSLPGFGISASTHETGWTPKRIAKAWVGLMRRIGYERYGAQGGEGGSRISQEVGGLDSTRVVGVHVNSFEHRSEKRRRTGRLN